MNFFRLLLLFLLLPLSVQATIYEDAEDKKTSKWRLISSHASSRVNNIHDLSKKSRVIEFKGDGTKHTYELRAKALKKAKNTDEYWLSWEMKFSEDFVIIVLVQSNIGQHYLVYTPGIFKGYMQYGLGDDTTNDKWQTVSRNLQEDIAHFDNRVKIISFKSFVLKGNGRVDNLRTRRNMLSSKKKLPNRKLVKKKLIKKYKQKKVTNTLPIITVEGLKLVALSIGEAYVEEGISAYDKEDGDINVVSMENIDSNEVGRYMVLYMATDSDGNMALDKRYVHVGNVENEEIKINSEDDEIEEDYKDEKIAFSEEEEQIRIWEKELTLREKELVEREKKSNNNWKRK